MNESQILFLKALKHALNHDKLKDCTASSDVWKSVFHIAEQQNVLPLIYEAAHKCTHGEYISHIQKKVRHQVMIQTQKTQEFLTVYQKLRENNLTPLVVKGLICRNCYPVPDLRPSSDEDVLISSEQFDSFHQILLSSGLVTDCADLNSAYEVSYRSKGALYLELHKSLFPVSSAYGQMNDLFKDAIQNKKEIMIEGTSVYTMNETDHLFYLIVHALKHFMHSGFGIRQVCDVSMFVNRYASDIDWKRFDILCDQVHGQNFAYAIFKIGMKYLTLDETKLPELFRNCNVDESFMLEDLLDSGIYGKSSLSRLHSSAMTLEAVLSDKQGKKGKINLMSSLFPDASVMQSRYAYVRKTKLLLPVAWIFRFIQYGKQTLTSRNNSALKSIQIGTQRIELLRKYKIIE